MEDRSNGAVERAQKMKEIQTNERFPSLVKELEDMYYSQSNLGKVHIVKGIEKIISFLNEPGRKIIFDGRIAREIREKLGISIFEASHEVYGNKESAELIMDYESKILTWGNKLRSPNFKRFLKWIKGKGYDELDIDKYFKY
jgi:hypothetical protein